jgi:ubiquinone/menaquinone biosynthesis C-methylase UbiE
MDHGDFTGLAENYSKYRPGYSPTVRDAVFGMLGKPAPDVEAADVGAGTGIWTRMLAETGARIIAVEPNADMRRMGVVDCEGYPIEYRSSGGEDTGLADSSVDLVTMASSFHWPDFDLSTREFHRILRPVGRFVALWNPRLIEANPLLVEIEEEIFRLKPTLKRVSSGSSGFIDTLEDRLYDTGLFDDLIYLEGRHVMDQTPEHYLGVWQSVNDIRVQLGPDNWAAFLRFVEAKTAGLDSIATTYRTRAWAARRKGA